jgi:ketosteroid isomerase-like protein
MTSRIQTATQNKAVVEKSFDAWIAGADNPFELLADDANWTIEGNSAASGIYSTKEAFLRDVIRPFNARMAVGIKPTVRSITADADRVVILLDARRLVFPDGWRLRGESQRVLRRYRLQRSVDAGSGRRVNTTRPISLRNRSRQPE